MMLLQLILNNSSAPLQTTNSGLVGGPFIAVLFFVFVIITVGGLIIGNFLRSLRKPELYGLRLDQIKQTWAEIEKNSEQGIMGIFLRSLRKPELYGLRLDQIKQTWAEIEKNSEQGIMGMKLSVIEADKLLDSVLRSMAVPGETMGERLKATEYKFQKIREVWPAHKLRNQMVHDSSFHMSMKQGKRALKEFEAALKLLNVL